MTTSKDRLIEFLSFLELGQNAFEKKVGIANGYISKLKSSIGSGHIGKISTAYPELNTTWLLTGEGEMLKDAKPKEAVIATDSVVIPNDVWEVIKNQAESIKIKDRQTTDTLEVIKKQAESLKTKDQQTSKVIEMLEEQLKKSQRVQAQFRAANLVVVEDE